MHGSMPGVCRQEQHWSCSSCAGCQALVWAVMGPCLCRLMLARGCDGGGEVRNVLGGTSAGEEPRVWQGCGRLRRHRVATPIGHRKLPVAMACSVLLGEHRKLQEAPLSSLLLESGLRLLQDRLWRQRLHQAEGSDKGME